MPKILMLRTTRGSDNGMTVDTYEAKKTYVVGDKLAEAFVDTLKVAELMPMRSSAPVEETKDARGSRENKDAAADKDENKEEKRSRRS